MKKNQAARLAVIAIISLVITAFAITPAQAQENSGRDFISSLKTVLESQLPPLPQSINGVSADKLKGAAVIQEMTGRVETLKARLYGNILLYEDLSGKLEKIRFYNRDTEDKVGLKEIFTGGFSPATSDSLAAALPAHLDGSGRETAKAAIEDVLTLINLKPFEDEAAQENLMSPKRGRIFYDNALQKVENRLKDDQGEITRLTEDIKSETALLPSRNVQVILRAGDNASYGGFKKNFQEGDPIFVGFTYSAEGVEGPIPVEWKLSLPGVETTKGNGTLNGGGTREYFKIYEGRIPQKAAEGKYDLEVTLNPDNAAKTVFSNFFLIGGIPVQLKTVFVLDGEKKARSIFSQGQSILLVMQYQPFPKGPETAKFTWKVYDPSGKEVPSLSVTKELKTSATGKSIQTKYVKAVIPPDADTGTYRFQATVTSGSGRAISEPVEFQVKTGFVAAILADRKPVKKGDKVSLISRVSGGEKPYKYSWKTDTGMQSDKKDVIFVFNTPGKRKITLTVTDSARPIPERCTASIFVEVK